MYSWKHHLIQAQTLSLVTFHDWLNVLLHSWIPYNHTTIHPPYCQGRPLILFTYPSSRYNSRQVHYRQNQLWALGFQQLTTPPVIHIGFFLHISPRLAYGILFLLSLVLARILLFLLFFFFCVHWDRFLYLIQAISYFLSYIVSSSLGLGKFHFFSFSLYLLLL